MPLELPGRSSTQLVRNAASNRPASNTTTDNSGDANKPTAIANNTNKGPNNPNKGPNNPNKGPGKTNKSPNRPSKGPSKPNAAMEKLKAMNSLYAFAGGLVGIAESYGLMPTETLVLYAMLVCSKGNEVSISQGTIAKRFNMNRRTVLRAISRLESLGLMQRAETGNSTKGVASRYRLDLPKIEQK